MASHKKRRLAHGQLDQQRGGVEDRRAAVEDSEREQRESFSPVHVPPSNNTGRVAGVALLVFGAVAYAALGLRSHETVAEGELLWRAYVRCDSSDDHAMFRHEKGGLLQNEARVACISCAMLPELMERCVEETVEQATAEDARWQAEAARVRRGVQDTDEADESIYAGLGFGLLDRIDEGQLPNDAPMSDGGTTFVGTWVLSETAATAVSHVASASVVAVDVAMGETSASGSSSALACPAPPSEEAGVAALRTKQVPLENTDAYGAKMEQG
jgi:hypothetical protein